MILNGKNIVVYDLEIENEIDHKNITWNDHHKMGLSVGALFDYMTGDYSVYFKEDIQELCARLNSAALVVAFNQIGFDNKLLRVLGGDLRADGELKNFDMLQESRKSVGGQFAKGLKLDDHLAATFGKEFMKTGHGEMAPKWWQEGKRAKVVSYCLADVRREKMLFEHIASNGWVKTLVHGQKNIDISRIMAL
jgi:DEAD/DEAH box helicase domain-containing protein